MLVSEESNTMPLAVDFGGRRVWGCFFPSRSSLVALSNGSETAAEEGKEDEEEDEQRGVIFQLTPHHLVWRSRPPHNSHASHKDQPGLGERMTGRKRPRLEMGLVEEDEGRVRLVLSDSLRVGCLTRTSGNNAKDGPGRVLQDSLGVDWIEVWGF